MQRTSPTLKCVYISVCVSVQWCVLCRRVPFIRLVLVSYVFCYFPVTHRSAPRGHNFKCLVAGSNRFPRLKLKDKRFQFTVPHF